MKYFSWIVEIPPESWTSDLEARSGSVYYGGFQIYSFLLAAFFSNVALIPLVASDKLQVSLSVVSRVCKCVTELREFST